MCIRDRSEGCTAATWRKARLATPCKSCFLGAIKAPANAGAERKPATKGAEAPMLRNSDTATSRSRRLHIGKDTEGNIYRRRGRRAKRINISAPGRRATEASCRGRSLPLSTRLRLTLRRVVSEATALPRPPSSLVERRRTRAGRAASSPGRASSGGCGRVAPTAGEGCRAAGCHSGVGTLCDSSQRIRHEQKKWGKFPTSISR